MSNTDIRVLAEILGALKRLETGLEQQNGRLYTLERCVSPGSVSSSNEDSPTHQGLWTPSIKLHQPMRLAQQADPTTPPSTVGSQTTSLPQTPILGSDARRFDLKDSCNDVENFERSEESAMMNDPPPAPQIEYAYTESAYASLSHSRLDLVMAQPQAASPSPTASIRQQSSGGYEAGRFSTTIVYPLHQVDVVKKPRWKRLRRIAASNARALVLTSRQKILRLRTPRLSKAAHEMPSYERVAMTYCALENFAKALRSSFSIRSGERLAARQETKRLNELAGLESTAGEH